MKRFKILLLILILLICNALNQNGFLDSRAVPIQNPSVSQRSNVIPPPSNSALDDIENQLKIPCAEHNFYSDDDCRG